MIVSKPLWLCLLFCAFAVPAQESAPTDLRTLQQQFNTIIEQPKYTAALWGAKVVSLDSGKTLFEHNAQKLFSPASNSKLYTVALALDRLGSDYRIKTSLYSTTAPDRHGVLKADLIVYGRGDPTLTAALHGGDIVRALDGLAVALTNAGVRRIKGDLIGDANYFRGPEYGSGWMWDDLEYSYGAEVSSLTINDNILSVFVSPANMGQPAKLLLSPLTSIVTLSNQVRTVAEGSRRKIHVYRPLGQNIIYVTGEMPAGGAVFSDEVPLHNPAELFIETFRECLKRYGVGVEGKTRTVQWVEGHSRPLDCGNLVELGKMESLPLRQIAALVLKPSQNLYADLLLAQVGEASRKSDDHPEETSEDLGIRELNRFVQEAGIKPGEVIFEEGSGLSRDNLTTPNATVTLLQYVNGRSYATNYLDALPLAGIDGTLRRRMRGTAAAGNVRAKTGTLRWATSLSGYVTTAAKEHLVFSFMVNRFQEPGTNSSRTDLDTMAALLARFAGRSGD